MSVITAPIRPALDEAAADADASALASAKGGRITGALIDDDVLASSRSVLARTRTGAVVGFQQYFTPDPVAAFIAKCLVDGRSFGPAFDPAAGNGSLLAPFKYQDKPLGFGIEIDRDQIHAAKDLGRPYRAVCGDVQKIAPILRATGMGFDHVVANPPFGLQWEDKKWGKASSTLLAWRYAVEFLNVRGAGAFICGRDRWFREVSPVTAGEPYFILEVNKIWETIALPTVIVFFTKVDLSEKKHHPDPTWLIVESVSDLTDALSGKISETRREQGRLTYARPYTPDDTWRAVEEEWKRRNSKAKDRPQFAVTVRGGKVRIYLSAFTAIRLAREANGERRFLESLNGQPVSYFALNRKDWLRVQKLIDAETITLEPQARPAIDKALADGERVATPLYPVPEVMRLAFVEDVDRLTCKTAFKSKFKPGESYPVSTRTIDVETKEQKPVLRNDKWEQAIVVRKRKALEITIGGEKFGEKDEDIHFILNHFELPDPGDVMSRFPDKVARWLDVLKALEDRFEFKARDLSFKPFQRDDLARILTKGGGMFSWEQGSGKTLGGLAFAEAVETCLGRPAPALFIVPQDLIPQWQRESKKFFNRGLIEIRTLDEARDWAKKLRSHPEPGLRFITYFEALSRNGRVEEWMDDRRVKWAVVEEPGEGHHVYGRGYVPGPVKKVRKPVTSADLCPVCVSDEHWADRRCAKCGYNLRKLYIKPLYAQLTRAFQNGVIVIDEATKIKSNDSLMSLSVRGLRARWKLAMTGTPVKNYICDAFWILWWALGNASPRFPYGYHGGAEKFLADFGVVEEIYAGKNSTPRRKILPAVSNLSRLWRLLASSNIRRRMEDLGEKIQPCTFHPTRVPFGRSQLKMYRWWLDSGNFCDWFIRTHRDSPLVKGGYNLVKKFAAAIGQLAKLEFSTTLPEAEPSGAYTETEQVDRKGHRLPKPSVSNMTPKTLKVLEIAKQHVANGEKVLILSDVQKTGAYLAGKLNEAGLPALHIVDQHGQTIGPRQRADIVKRFVEGGYMVLCASIQALNLGHNLDVASVCILDGLPWDFATLDQGIKRIRRLTSKKPVSVYPVLVEGSLDERKWKLLTDKGEAADLALDGHLSERAEKMIDLEQILKELQEKGIKSTGKEVDERDLESAWGKSIVETVPVPFMDESPLKPCASIREAAAQLSLF